MVRIRQLGSDSGCLGQWQACINSVIPSTTTSAQLFLNYATCFFTCAGNATGACTLGVNGLATSVANSSAPMPTGACAKPSCWNYDFNGITGLSTTCCDALGRYCSMAENSVACAANSRVLAQCRTLPTSAPTTTTRTLTLVTDWKIKLVLRINYRGTIETFNVTVVRIAYAAILEIPMNFIQVTVAPWMTTRRLVSLNVSVVLTVPPSSASVIAATASSSITNTQLESYLQSSMNISSFQLFSASVQETPSASSDSSSGNNGAVIGGAVGGALAGLIIVTLIIAYVVRKNKNEKTSVHPASTEVYKSNPMFDPAASTAKA